MFLLRDKLITQGEKRETSTKTCNETMLRNKLKVFVSRISPPLFIDKYDIIFGKPADQGPRGPGATYCSVHFLYCMFTDCNEQGKRSGDLAWVVQKVDNAIQRINHYPADKLLSSG